MTFSPILNKLFRKHDENQNQIIVENFILIGFLTGQKDVDEKMFDEVTSDEKTEHQNEEYFYWQQRNFSLHERLIA